MNRLSMRKDGGFTLLEVLIALLVLSIGLLGLAALQTTGLRSNQMASMRTQVTQQAYDITDRLRANPVQVSEYVITISGSTSATGQALTDLNEWSASLAQLPGGVGEITQVAGTPPILTITVRWDENRRNATGTDCPPQDKDDLRCFRLVFSE